MSGTAPALRLELADDVELHDDGRVLVGGLAGRVLRLSAAGARLVQAWSGGRRVGDGAAERGLAERLVAGGFAHPRWERGPYGPEDVTVVVPVLDDVAGLRSLVAALDDRLAIVVVDDGSADATAVRDAAGRARVVRNQRPAGPAAARNLGRASVETEVIAYVDADCRPEPDWLDELLPHFADPAVAAVAPRVRSLPGPSLLERYEVARSPLDLGAEPARVAPLTRVAYVPSTCLLVRSEVPEFDEDLRYGEDVDLGWRLLGAGREVRYEPRAEAWHRPRPSWRAWWRQRRNYGTAAAPLAARHPAEAVPLTISLRAAGVWVLAALRRPVAAALLAVGIAGSLHRRLEPHGVPLRRSAALAARGQLAAGGYFAMATTRTWWPLAVLAGAFVRRSRTALAAAALIPPVVDWARTRPDVDPIRYTVIRLADEVAYGTGVWEGCRVEGSVRALLPASTASTSSGSSNNG